ncbi:MAG: polyhydroxyalkanoic acid system family protein [Oleiphilaceae bacterium]|nr:polyhydroxyalkanoic acid system family protein [Oleiphilaceae bacterium]
MATIIKSRTHTHDVDHARESAEGIVRHLADQFGVKYHWEGDTLRFKGAGAKGAMTLTTNKLDLRMELGFMLLPLRSRIEREMDQYLDEFCS